MYVHLLCDFVSFDSLAGTENVDEVVHTPLCSSFGPLEACSFPEHFALQAVGLIREC